jgi:hypothetical protein
MDTNRREPVLWVKTSSISPLRIGASATEGFQILRAVPKGSPKIIKPPSLDKKSTSDIKSTYSLLPENFQTEWNAICDEANLYDGRIQTEETSPGFDWASNLLKVWVISVDIELSNSICPLVLFVL